MKQYAKIWSRDYTIHYNETLLQILTSQPGQFNLPFCFSTFYQGLSVAVTEREMKDELYHLLADKYSTDSKKFKSFKKEFNQSCKNYLKTANKYKKLNFSNLSNNDLIKILQDYYKPWVIFARYVFWAFALGEYQAEKVNDFLIKQAVLLDKQKRINDYLFIANRSARKSSIFLLEQEIIDYRKKGKTISINQLYLKYQWLPYNDLNAIDWTKDDFENYVKQFKPVHSKNISFSQLKNDLKITKQQEEAIKINQELAYLRDYRDEVRRRGVFILHPTFQEISQRLKIKYRDLLLFSTPEIIEFLQGKTISKKETRRRMKPAILVLKNGKLIFITGQKAKYYFNLIKEEKNNQQEVKGMIAYSGQVKGKAKIVKFDKDINRIKKGDIMVAIATHPDYLPKMRISKAIVTDEGGMTCHAAIVARELNIPCIVGTKVATRIFKDGDLIEVNTNEGIVSKVK